jgi:thiol-disulfide isomerase/thioredoxin
MFGRIHGLFINYIITGVINFPVTYYLLKINPFKKVGLFLLFFPSVLAFIISINSIISAEALPGMPGIIINIISTLSGIILYKSQQKRIVVIIYLLFLALAIPNYYNILNIYYDMAEPNQVVGTELPEIWITDKNGVKKRLKGNNKVMVIDLWSNSCANCITAFPKFEKVKRDYRNDSLVEFLSINIYQNKGEIIRAEKFLKGYTFKNYYSDESLFKKLNFNTVPNYIVIGKDNRLKYFGSLNMETLETYNNIYKLIENEK